MTITKSEFREWKDHPVTQAFYEYIAATCRDYVNELITNTREEKFSDESLRGAIQVLKSIPTIEHEDLEDVA